MAVCPPGTDLVQTEEDSEESASAKMPRAVRKACERGAYNADDEDHCVPCAMLQGVDEEWGNFLPRNEASVLPVQSGQLTSLHVEDHRALRHFADVLYIVTVGKGEIEKRCGEKKREQESCAAEADSQDAPYRSRDPAGETRVPPCGAPVRIVLKLIGRGEFRFIFRVKVDSPLVFMRGPGWRAPVTLAAVSPGW